MAAEVPAMAMPTAKTTTAAKMGPRLCGNKSFMQVAVAICVQIKIQPKICLAILLVKNLSALDALSSVLASLSLYLSLVCKAVKLIICNNLKYTHTHTHTLTHISSIHAYMYIHEQYIL